MTPRECFVFAARLRTSSKGERLQMKVNDVLSRLNMTKCADTKIGGPTMKGISGGERKRTSIGYELITNPKVLMLDEPTSGLDSTTSLNIIKMLKKEAKQGMNIIATIH